MSADRIFCDTNVFLNALDQKRSLNPQALHALNVMPNEGIELCVSGQVLRELLAVSTRPRSANGLGLGAKQATANARAILGRSTVLAETRAVADAMLKLVEKGRCAGKQVHDAGIVATMIAHGVTRLLTDNLEHLGRFREIEVVDLASLPSTAG
jgi:predicted nucleic acid-binding protein